MRWSTGLFSWTLGLVFYLLSAQAPEQVSSMGQALVKTQLFQQWSMYNSEEPSLITSHPGGLGSPVEFNVLIKSSIENICLEVKD